jgi:hypothetical protein
VARAFRREGARALARSHAHARSSLTIRAHPIAVTKPQEFNGVHAFMRDESSFGRYDPELATLTLQVIFAFFRRHLGGNLEIAAAAS